MRNAVHDGRDPVCRNFRLSDNPSILFPLTGFRLDAGAGVEPAAPDHYSGMLPTTPSRNNIRHTPVMSLGTGGRPHMPYANHFLSDNGNRYPSSSVLTKLSQDLRQTSFAEAASLRPNRPLHLRRLPQHYVRTLPLSFH